MTSQQPKTSHLAAHDILDTEVIVVSTPAPVFVDSTGRRRKVLRRVAYVFGAMCMLYGGLVSVSLAGGPVSSRVVLPLPDLRHDDEVTEAKHTPARTPAVTASPPAQFVTESFRRRPVSSTGGRRAEAPRPSATPSRTPVALPRIPAPRVAATRKPLESATTQPSPSPSTSGTPGTNPATSTPAPAPPANTPPPPPAPPLPAGTGGESSGGTGGGSTAGGATRVADPAPPTARPSPLPDPADQPEAAPAGVEGMP
ncbi:MAG TPA: hypothetical protein VFR35_05115 [Actinoplanes sp.]|nr:hypothetical protein [Actinoplanes sp.]